MTNKREKGFVRLVEMYFALEFFNAIYVVRQIEEN